MTELKPCPFCGSPAELLHTKTWDYFVRCTYKGCAARTRQYHENSVGAMIAWNRREDDQLKECLRDIAFHISKSDGHGIDRGWVLDRIRELGIEVDA